LVYFGYPAAHEDDAQRAVRTALGIIAALQSSPSAQYVAQASGLHAAGTAALPEDRLPPQGGKELRRLQVRIGIHTGLVVIGEIGSSEKREILAMGETPNIAARLQGLAEPDTVVISGVTYRLVQGLFECQDRGPQELKGISTPLPLYHVVGESEAQSRFEVAVQKGLTPLVGREHEVGLLQARWEQAKAGEGQVVLLSGEPGIGKSRLVQTLKEQVVAEGATRIEFRCSPYHQNSAFYPVIEFLQRRLQFNRGDSPEERVQKLEQALAHSRLDLKEAVPLFASLLSLPASRYTLPAFSPQKQKEKTHAALVAWLVEEAEQHSVYNTWEDLHWADPSTLEVLTLLLDQVPTARLLALLTFRPEFTPLWGNRSHLSQLTLSRLGRQHVEAMVEKVTGGKALPPEVMQQIVAKTDGVPLFVEELTKMVIESIGSVESMGSVGSHGHAPVTVGIPSTLQDALMARLDRLGPVKEIAQLGATIGREFSYELLYAVSPLDEETLQHGLKQLVEAELVYQRGLLPQAHYLFKHALVQDTAYQALLKSTRQQYHHQIAQVLVERFPETVETQPELLAHHYTEAGLIAQAIPYWQQAGERATQRSAYVEAISHLTKGLELLKTLPNTPERVQQELTLQSALGMPLIAAKGQAAPEVERTYTRARELCRQAGETPQLFGVLMGLWIFSLNRAEHKTAHELAEQCLRLAQSVQDSYSLVWAHCFMGMTLFNLGEFALAQDHMEQGIDLYNPQQHRVLAFRIGGDPGTLSLSEVAFVLWSLGYPDQALKRLRDSLTAAQEISHPYNLAVTLANAAMLHHFRREGQATQEWAEALLALSSEQGFPLPLATGTIWQGWALVEQGKREEEIEQMCQGLSAYRATGEELWRPYYLALLAEVHGKRGQPKEGLGALTEALAAVNKTGERFYEAELYRLKGELTLQQFNVQGSKFKAEESSESGVRSPESKVEESSESGVQSPKSEVKTSLGQVSDKSQASQDMSEVPNTQHPTPSIQAEAEACFLKAIEVARKQQAKSLELRATVSLARLWQQQGKQHEACTTLSEIYNWFTEGFDTKDLQEAKALLEELEK
jgi:predicted ATPase